MDHVASNCSDDEVISQGSKSDVPYLRVFQISSIRYAIRSLTIYAYITLISSQEVSHAVASFTVGGTSYKCTADNNMICLGDAHSFSGDGSSGLPEGILSLIKQNNNSYGIAYYANPVKLLDLSSNQVASFSTSFSIDVRQKPGKGILDSRGDGMTFLLSANNSYHGWAGAAFGIFDGGISLATPFKSVVVEFDTYYNGDPPVSDYNENHVSFDFANITAGALFADANASTDAIYQVDLGDEQTKYAWVEYDRDTQTLEVRVSYTNSRPATPLLSHTVNLFDLFEEYMWVGFSSASGYSYSNFYVGDWSFESSGIPSPSPPVIVTPSPPQGEPPSPSSSAPSSGSHATEKRGGNKTGLIAGISVAFAVLLLVCVTVVTLFVRKKKSGGTGRLGFPVFAEEDPVIQLEGMPERFSDKELSLATRGFSSDNKLGQGGFGSVYRGVLRSSGIPVAVKKIDSESNQGEKEFMAEVSIITRLRHRNLIQLQGWCKDTHRGKYLLVYELMSNGSLDKVLFQSCGKQTTCLSWAQRLNIITGTAAAVDYLHQGWKQQVIRRDIKSSNIMLDDEWNAKLGDFGLARLVDHKREAATTDVAGTYGYIAPEAVTSGRFTDKTDVFAFGAVVLEIVCGRKAFSSTFPSEEIVLVDWVWQSLSEGAMLKTVDRRLVEYDSHWMEVVMTLGLLCSHPNPLARPSMRQVVQVLAGDASVPLIPSSKPEPFSSGFDITATNHVHAPKS